jgi:hypothetical protein
VNVVGRQVHFYILVEHQLNTPRRMTLRVLEYTLLIWRQWRSDTESGSEDPDAETADLPLVVPIVLHPGPKAWRRVWRLRELIDIPQDLNDWANSFTPDCSFCLVDLAGVPWEKLAEGHLARAILAAIQGEREGPLGFEQVRRIVSELFEEEHLEVATELAALLWTFLLQASDLRQDEVRRIVEETIPPEEKEQFMSTAEMLKEEGRQEVLQEARRAAEALKEEAHREGQQEGRKAALCESVFDLLESRFGQIPAGLRESVLRIQDLARLRALVTQAGICASLEEFVANL